MTDNQYRLANEIEDAAKAVIETADLRITNVDPHLRALLWLKDALRAKAVYYEFNPRG